MTNVYKEPKVFKGEMKPYPHEEHGKERGRANNPVKFIQGMEQRARERQVAIETVRLLRRDVIECYHREGVNHYENCKEEVQAFYDVIIQKDLGQLQPKWADKRKQDGFA